MEAITALATTIAELIFTGAFEKSGADLMTAMWKIFKTQQTKGLPTGTENKPTESNVQAVKTELETQMNEDKDFEKKVRELVEKLKREGAFVQAVKTELETQMKKDNDFEKKVRELVEKLKKEGAFSDNKYANSSKYNIKVEEAKGSAFGDGNEIHNEWK